MQAQCRLVASQRETVVASTGWATNRRFWPGATALADPIQVYFSKPRSASDEYRLLYSTVDGRSAGN